LKLVYLSLIFWRQFAPLSDISQGSVATHFRCCEIFSNSIIYKFSLNSYSEIIAKIG